MVLSAGGRARIRVGAIKPGTKTAYVVVGGQAGGFVYTFKALAKGFAGSNGGSA